MQYSYATDFNSSSGTYGIYKSIYDYNNRTEPNRFYFFEYLGGILYDFGWWFRLTQIGSNSLFYPQYQYTVDSNKKFPIFNLSSIVNSIIEFNKKLYPTQEYINPVGLCLIDVGKYASLENGLTNQKYVLNNKNVCSKGNIIGFYKTSRTNPETSGSIGRHNFT